MAKRTGLLRTIGKKMLYALFILSVTATVLIKYALFPNSLFFIFLIIDVFLFFASLIAIQISWHTFPGTSGQSASSASFEQKFPTVLPELMRLSPTEFEEFIGLVFEALGYTEVQRIGGSGDRGADLLARNFFQLRIIVQCKLFSPDNKVDSPDMQRFLGSICHYRAIEGWFVTTSSYTQPALDFATLNNERIRLLNGEALVALIQQRQREIYFAWQQRRALVDLSATS